MIAESLAPKLRLGRPLSAVQLAEIERQLHLKLNKWDTQVGDTEVLSSQPIILSRGGWTELQRIAEQLAEETRLQEIKVATDRALQKHIGVPRSVRALLGTSAEPPTATMRAMRFDFHPTKEGWRVSEVNSDVPGGWREATSLPQLFQAQYPELIAPCSPLAAWCDSVHDLVGSGHVALLSAPGFLEDQQVILTFERELRSRGVPCFLMQSPKALDWDSGDCRSRTHGIRMSAVVRFYQLEWLCRLPLHTGWKALLLAAEPPVVNPTIAAISESKRFPLAFNRTRECPVWQVFVPESCDPRDVHSHDWDQCVLKATYSNTGDHVHFCSELSTRARERMISMALKHPSEWVAQRRFDTLPLKSVRGLLFPCIGVFVVNGRAVGAYGRLSSSPIVDGAAIEAPVMIDPTDDRDDQGRSLPGMAP